MRAQLTWLLMVAAAVGCSSDNNQPNNGGGTAGTVTVGNIFFESGHNGTSNPAVDTVAVGDAVTWTWTNTGNTPHSVFSDEDPMFASSDTLTGNGSTYSVTFTTPGTYVYECAIHGEAMTGTIVV